MKSTTINIEKEKWYSLFDMARFEFFPWLSTPDYRSYRRIVVADKRRKNILKANIDGTNGRKRYLIKGENIVKYIEAFEKGSV